MESTLKGLEYLQDRQLLDQPKQTDAQAADLMLN
jgi:hypothetical protein